MVLMMDTMQYHAAIEAVQKHNSIGSVLLKQVSSEALQQLFDYA
jgi:carbon monoxide dehydrogenase subunit G